MTMTEGAETLLYDPKAGLYADRLKREIPTACIVTASDLPAAIDRAPSADALIALAHNVTSELIAAMPKLRWIQALTTGIDPLLKIPNLRSDIVVTTARGVAGPQMAELAFMMMLAILRDLPRMLDNQKAGRWERWPQPLLHGKTILIVGVGAIAEELAVRCKAFGMTVQGISTTRRAAPGFDAVLPRSALAEAAARCDILVVLTPGSAENRGLIDSDILSRLKPSAIVLNLARGECVESDALLDSLRSGRIAGAGLDVFDKEPLASDSPLWTEPHVLITPHIGGFSDRYVEQMTPLLAHNLRAFIDSDPLRMHNRVSLH